MGRFALRKQEKIKAAFEPNGDEILNRILWRHLPQFYIERVKDNPRRNEVTPGVGTQ